ncbi:hypothetical protein T09_3146 [Trichinella sp. T9]|nr:hypothetical protein T09_3146 [Trichinella sp. T9]
MRRQKSRCQQHFDFFLRCRFMDVAGSHPNTFRRTAWQKWKKPRKCPLQCRDQGGPPPTLPPLKLNYRKFHDTWRDLYGRLNNKQVALIYPQ